MEILYKIYLLTFIAFILKILITAIFVIPIIILLVPVLYDYIFKNKEKKDIIYRNIFWINFTLLVISFILTCLIIILLN